MEVWLNQNHWACAVAASASYRNASGSYAGPDQPLALYLGPGSHQKFQQVRCFRSSRLSNRIERGEAPEVTPRSVGLLPVPAWRQERCGDMKLLTHNLLSSHVRGVGPRGFPLRLQVPTGGRSRSPLLEWIGEPGSGFFLTKPLRPAGH